MDRDKAYLDSWLWLPKSRVSRPVIENGLTLNVSGAPLQLWTESEHHYGVPRRFYQEDELIDIEIVDRRPTSYPRVGIRSLITLDGHVTGSTMQHDAYVAIKDSEGIVNVGCGGGKTVLLLHAAAERGYPTLVINDKISTLMQWRNEALGTAYREPTDQLLLWDPTEEEHEPPKLEMDGEIGWIRGKPSSWRWKDCPLVLGSMRTIYEYEDAIIEFGLGNRFGTVIWDEVHHLPARRYVRTASMFVGFRYGITATMHRPDGAEAAFLGHIGPVLYRNLDQDMIPKVTFVRSPTRINMGDPEVFAAVTGRDREINHKKLCRHVGLLERELNFVTPYIDSAIEHGKDILAITMSRDHVIELAGRYEGAAQLHYGVSPDDRLRGLHGGKLAFGTADMAVEALNKKSLDTLFILTEFSSENWLQQAVGRIQRFFEGKNNIHVIVIWHEHVPMLGAQGKKLQRLFEERGFPTRTL